MGSLCLREQQLQRGEEGLAVVIIPLVRSLWWTGGLGVSPKSSTGRICVAVPFLGNTSSPDFAKWSIFPKAAQLFAAKTVLSPPDTQHFPGWINGQLFQEHMELPQPASLLLLSCVFIGVVFFSQKISFQPLTKPPEIRAKNSTDKKTNSIIIFLQAREIIARRALLLLPSPRKVLRAGAAALSGGA